MRFAWLMAMSATAAVGQGTAVTVHKGVNSYTLENAYVKAEIERGTGDLKSLKYGSQELMGYDSGHHAGYWEQNPSGAGTVTDGLSIDPAANAGERAEVFIKGVTGGKTLGKFTGGSTSFDLEIRYSLGKEDHGLYTYAVFSHPADYPASGLGESRFGAKLSPDLDWLSENSKINELMPSGYDWDHGQQMNMKEARKLTTGQFAGRVEHKYDYSVDQFDMPAFGWSSTKKHVGIYFINPSQEFMSGGPTKVELVGHIDDGAGGDPTLLDYWRSSHYGGSSIDVAAGEAWNKVVGPIFLYCDSGATPQAMFTTALTQASAEQKKWPYAWVKGIDYPAAGERANVTGTVAITETHGKTWVGLVPPGDGEGGWQHNAKGYQFWVVAAKDGSFTIPNVRPGTYEVRALADGVFGEFDGAKVTVAGGGEQALGTLAWKPLRYGKQLWEIGVPNRNATEFQAGNDANHWGMYLIYAKLHPKDIDYTIGVSDYRKDWYFEQVPNAAHPAEPGPYNGGDTTWTIHFKADAGMKGVAVLRTGLVGVGARHVLVGVNGKQVGDLAPLQYNATINRDGVQGLWTEHDVVFPASALAAGDNTLTLTVPKGNVMQGVIYDYLRLELDETGKGPKPNAAGQPKESAPEPLEPE